MLQLTTIVMVGEIKRETGPGVPNELSKWTIGVVAARGMEITDPEAYGEMLQLRHDVYSRHGWAQPDGALEDGLDPRSDQYAAIRHAPDGTRSVRVSSRLIYRSDKSDSAPSPLPLEDYFPDLSDELDENRVEVSRLVSRWALNVERAPRPTAEESMAEAALFAVMCQDLVDNGARPGGVIMTPYAIVEGWLTKTLRQAGVSLDVLTPQPTKIPEYANSANFVIKADLLGTIEGVRERLTRQPFFQDTSDPDYFRGQQFVFDVQRDVQNARH